MNSMHTVKTCIGFIIGFWRSNKYLRATLDAWRRLNTLSIIIWESTWKCRLIDQSAQYTRMTQPQCKIWKLRIKLSTLSEDVRHDAREVFGNFENIPDIAVRFNIYFSLSDSIERIFMVLVVFGIINCI